METRTEIASATASLDPLIYQVLYYKRKNKVHKTKGVSKADGKLEIHPPPSNLVKLLQLVDQDDDSDVADDNSMKQTDPVVYSGINAEVSRRAFCTGGEGEAATPRLQMDDVVILPRYECQITGFISSAAAVEPKRTVIKGTLQATTSTYSLSRRRLKCQSIHSSKNGTKRIMKHDWKQNRRPPPQPIQAPSEKDSQSDDEEKDTMKYSFGDKVIEGSHKRKFLCSTRGTFQSKQHGLHRSSFNPPRKRSKSVPSSSSPQSADLASFDSTLHSSHTDFPAALGNDFVVPPSIRKILRPHQVTGIAFLWNCLTGQSQDLHRKYAEAVSCRRYLTADGGGGNASNRADACPRGAILADEMGLGKTLMTIATVFALHRRNKGHRFIVVCPSSLVTNWDKEFDKWLGRASQPKRRVVSKGGQEGIQIIRTFATVKPNCTEVLIISYDLFRMNVALLEEAQDIGLLVVDEGHKLKNAAGSLTLQALQSLPSDARLLITGTPIQNCLSEFHTVANFVCPGLLGDLASFRREYERPINAANNKTASPEQRLQGFEKSRALDRISKSFLLRRLQKDILKTLLPPRTELLLFCRPSPLQCSLYRHLSNQAVKGSSSSLSGVSAEQLNRLTNLRKLCCHPSLVQESVDPQQDDDQNSALQDSGKLLVLDALLWSMRCEAPNDKVVVISNFTTALTVIQEKILQPRQMAYKRLDGHTDRAERQPMVDSFNRSTPNQCFVFLLSSKAGGCGLNLVGANRLVMFDADFNPATDLQAMARVYRQGQVKPCFIYRLFTCGTVEEVVYQRQQQKGLLATMTVDGGGKPSASGFTKDELRDIFTLKDDGKCNCDTKEKMGSDWPDYSGPQDLLALGCDDQPLRTIAEEQASVLRFVHIVEDTLELGDDDGEDDIDAAVCVKNLHPRLSYPRLSYPRQQTNGSTSCDYSDESKDENITLHKQRKLPDSSSSSDEEFEFEG